MGGRQNRRKFMKLTASAGGAIAFSGVTRHAQAQDSSAEKQVTDFFEVVRTRRSVRRFKSDPVPEDHLMQILDSACMAPTSGNQQPWKFLVVRDRDLLDRLKDACVEQGLAARREWPESPPKKSLDEFIMMAQ